MLQKYNNQLASGLISFLHYFTEIFRPTYLMPDPVYYFSTIVLFRRRMKHILADLRQFLNINNLKVNDKATLFGGKKGNYFVAAIFNESSNEVGRTVSLQKT